ncbi:protein of unknown function [Candidatus Nitrospira inopinata]|jgi:hypothetical protein|uniref:Uncharacterized protein n=1 Tax=Candidatus Nitrospira inopinata TaxID=1715989 RepID=A0A0S4KPV4_9BACT|nr:protein of unknown function [Candidatus Nitrospira inopinata]
MHRFADNRNKRTLSEHPSKETHQEHTVFISPAVSKVEKQTDGLAARSVFLSPAPPQAPRVLYEQDTRLPS